MRGKLIAVTVTILILGSVFNSFLIGSIPVAKAASSVCQGAQFLQIDTEGVDAGQSSMTITGGSLFFTFTSKAGTTCTTGGATQNQAGLTAANFDNGASLFTTSGTFASYKITGGTYQELGGATATLAVYAVITEDKATAKGAQFQGIFFKFVDSSTPYDTNTYFSPDGKNAAFNFGNIIFGAGIVNASQNAAKYRDYYALTGKSVANAVVSKYNLTLNLDLDIDYTKTEVGSQTPPYQPSGEPAWQGAQKTLPGLSDKNMSVQLWYRPTGGKGGFTYLTSYNNTSYTTPSDGKIAISLTNVPAGDYTLTSFMQVTYNGTISGVAALCTAGIGSLLLAPFANGNFNAKMLSGTTDSSTFTGDNATLDSYEGIAESTDQIYVGCGIDRGRQDTFEAKQTFSVGDASAKTVSATYVGIATTTDAWGNLASSLLPGGSGSCGLQQIFGGIGQGIGTIIATALTCLYTEVFVPGVNWAASWAAKGAGLSYIPPNYRGKVTQPFLTTKRVFYEIS